jgi:hypothetical protein
MAITVVGLFDSLNDAVPLVQNMVDSGFSRDAISLLVNDAYGLYKNYRFISPDNPDDAQGAMGATAGAVGGTFGLLTSIGEFAIPGIGPAVAAGPLVQTLTSAGVGTAGSLIDALVGVGIPVENAVLYAEGVRQGGTMVMVWTDDNLVQTAYNTMQRYRVVDLNDRATKWRETGWTTFDETATYSPPPGISPVPASTYYVCPAGDYEWTQQRAGETPPLCPNHRIPLVRGAFTA